MTESLSEKQKQFLFGTDFLRLGQAINREHWQPASMTLRRIEQTSKELELDMIAGQLPAIRNAILRHNKKAALDALTRLTQRRVQAMNRFSI